MPAGQGEVTEEVCIVGADGVMLGGVLLTGTQTAGSVDRIVREKLAVARESEFPLQPFSFINQTLHL